MPRSVDLFIDSDLTLVQMAAELSDLVGTELVPSVSGDSFVLRRDSLEVILAEHRLDDGRELPLACYRFALSAQVAATGRPDATPEAAALREISGKIREKRQWPALLVLDLQYRDGGSSDTVDGGEVSGTGPQGGPP